MNNDLRPLKIFENETCGKSYSTHRYCYDTESPPEPFYEKEKDFIFDHYGETEKPKKPIDLSPIVSKLKIPLFSFFLDGSRRVYKLDDIQYNNRIYPILLGQIGASCCQRNHDGYVKNFRTENRLILAVPSTADPDGGSKSKFFEKLCAKINNGYSPGNTLKKKKGQLSYQFGYIHRIDWRIDPCENPRTGAIHALTWTVPIIG